MISAPLTIGIEEEYQIIDPETRQLSAYVQQIIDTAGSIILRDQVKKEFMQSQVEIASEICKDVKQVRHELIRLRRDICKLAQQNDRRIIAASTHPFSPWKDQKISQGERYEDLASTMQEVGRRMLIFGMHIHLGFGKDDVSKELIIDILNQIRYFLPHILVLTTSSPFWQGRNTGLKSYRSIIFENMPRTGIPPIFSSFADYMEFVDTLGKIDAIGQRADGEADYTKLWWDARPHGDFGTLEIRIADTCTTIDEATCIAALTQAIAAKLIKLRQQNQSWRIYRSEFIAENKWRAVRYGLDGKLADYGKAESIAARYLVRELVEFVDDVVDELNSREEVAYVHTILEKGTSADRQIRVYEQAKAEGASNDDAMKAVVDHLIEETMQGIDMSQQ